MKKFFRQKFCGFSLIEIMVALIVVAIITSALMPIITKRLTLQSTIKNRISTNCSNLYPNGYCSMCYITPKQCIVCSIPCNDGEVKNNDECKCENCKTRHKDDNCANCNLKYCTQCENGYYLDDNHKCQPCPKGHYCYKNDKTSKMEKCPKGTANDKLAQSICTNCAASSSTSTGTYTDTLGNITCTPCSKGSYAATSASTSCSTCPAGYYCPDGKYIPCPKGSANSLTGQISCTNCVASSASIRGTYTNTTGKSYCDYCLSGQYSTGSGKTACNSCPAGYYCPDGKKIPCPSGTFSKGSATACSACASGTYSASGASSCLSCSSKFPNCKICNYNKCTQCQDGYTLSSDGTKCEKKGCPAKTLKISTSSGDLCVTQYNMGDAPEFPLAGVKIYGLGGRCSSYDKYCCWQGFTSPLGCNSSNGSYSGCNRTVCNHYAAEVICANLKYDNKKWRLPTNSELSYFYYASKDKGSSGLMICDRSSNGYYGFSACSGTSSGCDNASNSSCAPGYLWTSQLNKTSTAYRWDLYKGGWDYKSSSRLLPLSVRCVTEYKE